MICGWCRVGGVSDGGVGWGKWSWCGVGQVVGEEVEVRVGVRSGGGVGSRYEGGVSGVILIYERGKWWGCSHNSSSIHSPLHGRTSTV